MARPPLLCKGGEHPRLMPVSKSSGWGLERELDHHLHFPRPRCILGFPKRRQRTIQPGDSARHIRHGEVIGDRTKIVGVVQEIERFEADVEGLSLLRKYPVQPDVDRGVSRTRKRTSAEEWRSIGTNRVAVNVSAGISGDRRCKWPAASGPDDAIRTPSCRQIPYSGEIDAISLVPPAQTPLIAGVERVIACATGNLVSRRLSSIDELRQCVIEEKLETMAVL